MGNPKDEVATLLKNLPDDASYEDIQYHLYVLEKAKRGIERTDSEDAIPHETAKLLLDKWLTP